MTPNYDCVGIEYNLLPKTRQEGLTRIILTIILKLVDKQVSDQLVILFTQFFFFGIFP